MRGELFRSGSPAILFAVVSVMHTERDNGVDESEYFRFVRSEISFQLAEVFNVFVDVLIEICLLYTSDAADE